MQQQLIVANMSAENLVSVARLVSRYPPFSHYGFAAMFSTLADQLQRQTNVVMVRDGKFIAYAGWFLTSDRIIQRWLAGEAEPVPDWKKPEAALCSITVTTDPRVLLPLIRGISDRCAGLPVYRKRSFQGDRVDHKRPPITGRQQFARAALR